jgi:hypothetical protein
METSQAIHMSPPAALELQIARHREMSGEDRLAIAREGIRAQHPVADEKEVERRLQQRLTLARAA